MTLVALGALDAVGFSFFSFFAIGSTVLTDSWVTVADLRILFLRGAIKG
jgi:hypothetical protein